MVLKHIGNTEVTRALISTHRFRYFSADVFQCRLRAKRLIVILLLVPIQIYWKTQSSKAN